MKKYLLRSAIVYLFCVVAFGAAVASAQSVDSPTYLTLQPPIVINEEFVCAVFNVNLKIGSRGAEVSRLQKFLNQNGHLRVQATGYFGPLTFAAVQKFQKANGVVSTGYFGPLTRAKIKIVTCDPQPQPDSEWYLKVVTPSTGTQWQMGTNQTISWVSKLPPSFAAYQYTVTLTPVNSCPPGLYCAAMFAAPRPFTIVDGTINTSANWVVGTIVDSTDQGRTITAGDYTVRVCVKNGGNCAESGKITITNPSNTQALQYSVTTDKNVYKQNEKIQIALKVTNNTSSPQTVSFTSGCQATYTIGSYNYIAARACIMSLGSVAVPAYGSHTWYLTHDPAEFQLAPGIYTLNASLLNNSGYASTNVIIVQ